MIEAEAKKNKYVLVTEPAREGGKVVTGRKGVGRFDAVTKGVAAHSGSRHADGRSAIREMANVVLAIESMTDYGLGVTTNIGQIQGGSGVNVIPHECTVEIDLRVPTQDLADEYTGKILGLTAQDPDVTLEITGGMNRPPYQKDDGIQSLFDHAKGVCAELGFELEDMHTGGGSDGCFTAPLGIPTLDGLGRTASARMPSTSRSITLRSSRARVCGSACWRPWRRRRTADTPRHSRESGSPLAVRQAIEAASGFPLSRE